MNKVRIATFAKQAFAVATILFSAFVWLAGFFRFSAVFLALICGVILIFTPAERRLVITRVFRIGFIALSLLPADISFRTRPGPPKFVPVIYGLPIGNELFEQERRGDLILGGSMVNGWCPMWLLVW